MSRRGQKASLEVFANALGHRFNDIDLLEKALTHPSAASPAQPDNQRLEFLGDRVLGLVIAEALMAAYPDEAEGSLAPRFNQLVRRETLAEIASEISLGEHLLLGRSESASGGRHKKAILADAMEAVIAAIHRDAGIDSARAFILEHWQGRIEAPGTAPLDSKTRLQEWAQARGMAPPVYEMTARAGPDHAPLFTVSVSLDSGETATGQATSKKAAEQLAAAQLLASISRGTKA